MSQCVPRLDLDDNFVPPLINTCAHSSSSSYLPPDVPSLDYQVTELACENEQPAMHGLRPSRVTNKPTASDSPTHAAGTLESIVNQATRHQPQPMAAMDGGGDNADELVRWLQRHPDAANPAADAVTMDALVPCDNINKTIIRNKNQEHASSGAAIAAAASLDGGVEGNGFARVGMSSCGTDGSASESATCGEGESRQLTLDSYEGELGGTWTSLASPENIISGREYTKTTAGDDLDSVSHSRPQWDKIGDEEGKKGTGKISVSNKRSRAAANHNQSERKRRDRINQRINTLQKMVPNSSKTDKASMLDEVIEYLKKLQAQVHMMSMSPMMLPLPMQQQLHMSMMMAGMGMRMGMGVMDMNDIGRWVPPVISPAAFKMADNSRDRLPAAPPGSMVSDPFPAFLTYQSQPTSMDAYRRLAALYQQQFQQQAPAASASKN